VAPKIKTYDIQSWLDVAVKEGAPGDRLPTTKALMKRLRTGQKSIQAAMGPYIDNGVLVSRRGLGTIIAPANLGDDARPLKKSGEGDVLVLRRTSENAIAPNLVRSLECHLQQEHFLMLQVSYANEDQALELLSPLGRFKSCLLQNHFHKLSIDFLAALNDRVQHIVVDGAYVSGVDVDSISTDWRRAMFDAFKLLRDSGHERIALLTSAHSAQTLSTVRREFRQCSQLWGQVDSCPVILLDALPGDYHSDDIVVALEGFRTSASCLEFSALVTWGVVEGVQLDMALNNLDICGDAR